MSRRTRLAVVLVALVLSPQSAIGISPSAEAQATPPRVTLGGTESHQFHSEISARDFELMVALPSGYSDDGDVEYPVLYVLDAGWGFALVVQAYRVMQLGKELQPMILVGIHTPGESVVEHLVNRTLDFTPSRNLEADREETGNFGREFRSGGANVFLRVLSEEIIPWAEARYQAGPERGLAGDSYGGLFALHALLRSPALFTHYLIGSPSLWWDDGVMFEREEAYSAEHKELAARVFMSAGTLEDEGMLPDMLRMGEILTARSYAGLELTTHIFMGETHLSVIPATMSRGMRVLFPAAE